MTKTKESSPHGNDELRCSEIQKQALAEYGIYTQTQLMEEFNKPFYIDVFTVPASRNLTAMAERAEKEEKAAMEAQKISTNEREK